MRVNIIVAAAENGVIGRAGDLPWKISADLKRFKQITIGHPIVMGRKTFESLPNPLPGRKNIIITRQRNYSHVKINDDCLVASSLAEVMTSEKHTKELMVIGGAAIYREALPYSQRIFFTEVHANVAGDVYFPEFSKAQWTETLRAPQLHDTASRYRYSFVVLERA